MIFSQKLKRQLSYGLLSAFIIMIAFISINTLWRFIIQPGFFPKIVETSGSDIFIVGPVTDNLSYEVAFKLFRFWVSDSGPVTLYIDSTGGYTNEAISISRYLKIYSNYALVTTVVPENGTCESACGIIFAAGNYRYVDPQSLMMFHGIQPANFISNLFSSMESQLSDALELMGKADSKFINDLRAQGVFDKPTLKTFFTGNELSEYSESFAIVKKQKKLNRSTYTLEEINSIISNRAPLSLTIRSQNK
jgi:ATP-dependent protease ClpP protease subunit